MLKVNCTLVGISPLSFSAPFSSEKNSNEDHAEYDERCWRERLHVDADGDIILPPSFMKNCLSGIAKHLSEKVPGMGLNKFGKYFDAGIAIFDSSKVMDKKAKAIKAKDVVGEIFFVPSDGRRGGGSRVKKRFPMIPEGWRVQVEIIIIDDSVITPSKIQEYLQKGGLLTGIGRYRPQNGGHNGRFKIEDFQCEEIEGF